MNGGGVRGVLLISWALLAMVGPTSSQSSDATRLLIEAAMRGDVAGITAAISRGATVDAQDSAGQTALLIAVRDGRIEAFKALLAAGADINAQAGNKDTPWLLAGALGRTEMLSAMIPHRPDYSIRNRYGGNALIPACERAHVDTVKLLLTTPIKVDHVNDFGWTCLLEIVILGDGGLRHQAVARMVLDAGADPNLADKDGVTPLSHARAKGQTVIADMIAAKGGR